MPASALIRALRSDRFMRYIDKSLIKHQRKGWSKMTEKEKGEYSILHEVFNADKELSIYEDQLFYALGKYPEIDKAFKGSSLLDEALVTKAFSKKIDTTLDDYIKRIEDMIKGAESGKYTYTTDDISALLEELAEEGLTELIKDRKSLNMLTNPLDISIDEAGKLDVLVDAVKEIAQKFSYVGDKATPTRTNPILFNLRLSKQHINNLDDVQINKPKRDWRDDDVFNGEDAQGVFGDPSIHDTSINSDMSFNAAYHNVAKEAKYKPTEPANFEFVMEGDAFPLPPKTGKSPKFEVEDIKIKSQWDEIEEATDAQMKEDFARGLSEQGGKLSGETGIAYVERLRAEIAAAEQHKYRGQSMQKRDLSVEDNQEGAALVDKAEATIKRLQEELDAYLGITKKQGGGFIDSPLYLRDY
jgi:hypothetical protein